MKTSEKKWEKTMSIHKKKYLEMAAWLKTEFQSGSSNTNTKGRRWQGCQTDEEF
jgi:hypothetical protein